MWATAFRTAGLVSRELVALKMGNSPTDVVCWLALLANDSIPVLLHPAWRGREVSEALDAVGSPRVLAIGAGSVASPAFEVQDLASPKHPSVSPDLNTAACVLFTSGTTGFPKAVAHSHERLLANVSGLEHLRRELLGHRWELLRLLRWGMSTLGVRKLARAARTSLRGWQVWCTPFSYSTIAGHIFLLQALLSGQAVVVVDRFTPASFVESLAREQVNVVALPPVALAAILRLPNVNSLDLRSLVVVGVGGASCPETVVRNASRSLRCLVTTGYGTTEAGGPLLVSGWGAHGRLSRPHGDTMPGVLLRVLGSDGSEASIGQPGEVVTRLAKIERTTRDHSAPSKFDGAEWQPTGDWGVRRVDGSVELLGRKDDLINRGSAKVHAQEIERVVEQVSGVERAAVVGLEPTTASGSFSRIICFVSVERGDHDVSVQSLREHCITTLAQHKIPEIFEFCENLPVNDAGEVLRSELRTRAADTYGHESARLRSN
jgi:long-chain acyl-CoA synthetase